MNNSVQIPKPGQTAIVRNRPAIIRDVSESTTVEQEIIHGVSVEYIDGITHPSEDYVIWEREIRKELLSGVKIPNPNELTSIDRPDLFQSFIDSYRWSSLNRIEDLTSEQNTGRIISPWLSAVQIEDYQLYPVWKALMMPRITMLLADDVGLGKTIEAGLILNELTARGRLRRILIICPASLQIQWRDEMAEKFSLNFTIVNRETTQEVQKEYGVDSNPWSFYSRIITSVDYLRQRDVQESFESASRAFSDTNSLTTPWDMLIIDEAHNIAPKRFGDESDRLSMIRQIIPYFEHRLFLTATPHNGFTESFTGLLEVLNPLVFEQKSSLDKQDEKYIQQYVIRRLKSEFKQLSQIQRFCERSITRINPDQRLLKEEKDLFDALRKYREKALSIVEIESGSKKYIVGFLITLLTKRLLSSHYAFACTWWNHFAGLQENDIGQDEVDYAIRRLDSDLTDDEEKDTREEEAVKKIGTWFSRHAEMLKNEINSVNIALEKLGWSKNATDYGLTKNVNNFPDSKWQSLEKWIEQNLLTNGKLRTDERVIIFTEYKHTLDYLLKRLQSAGFQSPVLHTLIGGAGVSEREEVKMHFNDDKSPLRILLVTDVASEGINLQNNCRYVIHYEIPWNPMRLEQRNGRVDRFGQSRDVTVFHYVTEDEEDFSFLEKVVHKVETIREDLGKVSELLDKSITRYFTGSKAEREAAVSLFESISADAASTDANIAPDRGGKPEYEMTLQQLKKAELELKLSSSSIGRLLDNAFQIEGGRIVPHESEKDVFVIQNEPPRWKKLIDVSLRIRSNDRLNKALPRLVFESSYFQKIINGRFHYTSKPDTKLIRIAHPVLKKALNLFRRSLWDIPSYISTRNMLNRFSLSAVELPAGIYQVVSLYLHTECYNKLREKIHEEVTEHPFILNSKIPEPMIRELWESTSSSDPVILSGNNLSEWLALIRQHWFNLDLFFTDYINQIKKSYEQDFEKRLLSAQKNESLRTGKIYLQRLEELRKRKDASYIDKIKKNLLSERAALQQSKLFTDQELDRLDRLKEIENNLDQLISSKSDYLQEILSQEFNRLKNIIIPNRYSIGYFDIKPLGVQIFVNTKYLNAR